MTRSSGSPQNMGKLLYNPSLDRILISSSSCCSFALRCLFYSYAARLLSISQSFLSALNNLSQPYTVRQIHSNFLQYICGPTPVCVAFDNITITRSATS